MQKMKKIDIGLSNYQNNITKLECPICHSDFNLNNNSLRCLNNHNFNFNKKGYVTFTNKANNDLYTNKLFSARNYVFKSGLFNPVVELISSIIKDNFSHYPSISILDAGCGEGYYLDRIANLFNDTNTYIGVDLSSQAIAMATDSDKGVWMVGDLTNLPIKTSSLNIILNILSPANYDEFNRLLAYNGVVIKVVPNHDYLKEIRELATDKQDYSNERIVNVFNSNFVDVQDFDLKYSYDLDEQLKDNLIDMTPLTSHLNEVEIELLKENDINQITIDLKVLVGRKK